jgi:hypothetical protein
MSPGTFSISPGGHLFWPTLYQGGQGTILIGFKFWFCFSGCSFRLIEIIQQYYDALLKNILVRQRRIITPLDPQPELRSQSKKFVFDWEERTFVTFRLKREERERQREGCRQGQGGEVSK